MSSPFQAPPAGTEVPPSSDARYFYRRQVYSRNPVTEGNWQAGKSVNFTAEASGGHFLVPSECRIVAKLLIKNSAGEQLELLPKQHCGVRLRLMGRPRLRELPLKLRLRLLS